MNLFPLDTHASYVLMQWLHCIGRMAFPLFVFLLVLTLIHYAALAG